MLELSTPFPCWVRVILATLVGLGGVSYWTSPSSTTPFPPLLSLFPFLSAGSVCTQVGGIGVGGLGTTGTSRATVRAWDSSRESKFGSFFSITIHSGTSIPSWSSLTKVVVNWELSFSSSDVLVGEKISKSSSQMGISVSPSKV